MKKWTFFIALLVISILAIPGVFAGGQTEKGGAAAASKNAIKIGVASQTMKEAVYRDMKDAAMKKAEELGVYAEWQVCELDPEKEVEIVRNYITRGFNVIVIEPVNPATSTQMAEICAEAGVPIVDLEAIIVADTLPKVRITGDFKEIGRAQVREFLKDFGKGPANMVILSGTLGDNVAQDMTDGYKEVLAQNPQIKVIQQEWHKDWSRELAMNTMQNVLARGDKVDVVIANNDAMGVGAVRAADEAGVKDKIRFYAMDHDKDAVVEILNGAKYKTVDKTSYLQGERCIIAAVDIANGKTPTYDKVVDGIPTWYTPFNFVTPDDLSIAKNKFPDLFKQ